MSDYEENERRNIMGKPSGSVYKSEFKKETLKEIKALGSHDWDERGLRKEILEYFGVKCKMSTELGPPKVKKVYFPYYSQEGKLTGFKVKDLDKDKHEKFHFYTVGYVGTDCQLFGQKECKGPVHNLKITEGECDQLSAYQSLLDRQKSNKTPEQYRKLKPQVVSIGVGTVNAVDHISSNDKFIDKYKKVWLCFDNDELSEVEKKKKNPGMRGKEATEAVGGYLIHKDTMVLQWPDYFKDASDALQKGKSEELAELLLFRGEKFRSDKIVTFSEVLTFEEAFASVPIGLQVPAFPKLTEKLKGFRPNEFTVLTTFSGVGKSTIAVEIAYEAALQGKKVGLIMLEEGNKKTFLRLAARRLGIHPNIFKFNPRNCGKKEDELKEAWDWVNDEGRFKVLNHYGSIEAPSLMDKMRSLHFNDGCEFIVFDHISQSVAGLNSTNEVKDLDMTMSEFSAFHSVVPVHTLAVCHLNRLISSGFRRPEKEPIWRYVDKEYLRGSSAIEGNAWNIIGIHREDNPDGTRGRIMLGVLKNREADLLSDADITKMHPETGLFYNAENDIWTPKDGGY